MEQVFEPTGLGLTIFRERYARHEEETWEEAAQRIAEHVAAAEDNGKVKKYTDRFKEQIVSGRFIPGGRILRGAGRPVAQLLNCFVIPSGDTIQAWGKTASDVIVVSGRLGGIGINMSPIRPRGADIKGTGGKATGAVSYMELINGIGDTIVGGGGRRMALMLCLDINHPDIPEFLDSKLDLGKLNNANISVVINMPIEQFQDAVRNDEKIPFEFNGVPTPNRKEIDGELQETWSVSARDLWNRIVQNAWKNGEPGVLNGYLANQQNNIWYHKPLVSTNPCITGETLIAVADGRNAVSIAQLATEGKDVPVYCSDPVSGQTVIRMGRNPRITGVEKKIWKLTLDDGSSVRATADHRFLLRNGQYVELRHLKPGDQLRPFNSYESNGYRQIADSGAVIGKGGKRRSRRQYRLIYEFFNGEVLDGLNIHHKNFDAFDDKISNLRLMSEEEHRLLHSERMRGNLNPYHRMSEDWKFRFASHPGFSNPRANLVTNEELIQHGSICWEINGGKISQSLWINYAKENNLPQFLANSHRFGSWTNFKNAVASNHKVVSIEEDGFEDVYNITVDEHHNYHIITSYEDDRFIRSSGVCVKNCGEIWLEEYGCCDLGALVLPNFVSDGVFDWDNLDESVRLGVRFLDDVLSINHYPLPEIKANCEEVRRIGLGVMGLHTMLMKLGMRYDSKEGHEFVDRLFNTIKNTAYDASINLAIEKGPFPAYDQRFLDAGFVKTLKRGIRNKIKEHGIRNCALLTIAPTGTTSMVAGVSSGIEPIPAAVYWRTRFKNTSDGNRVRAKELVVDESYMLYRDVVQGAADISVRDHFEMQKIVQKHIDNAVSKTINLPNDYKVDDLAELWLEYLPYMKGSTFYRWGSREFEPIQPVPVEEWDSTIASTNGNTVYDFDIDTFLTLDCPGGVCDLPQQWVKEIEKASAS